MAINQSFIAELQLEAEKTKSILARVPVNNPSWKPHPKSMELQRLARHVAELPTWATITVTTDELDFQNPYPSAPPLTTADALVKEFDKNVNEAIEALKKTDDARMSGNWSLRNGEQVFFTLPRHIVLRDMVFNHLVHHRAQLGVYLRLLDVPLPPLYGPTADEQAG